METSQKNNYKNEHIASKKALSATGIVTLIRCRFFLRRISFRGKLRFEHEPIHFGHCIRNFRIYKNLHGGKSVLPQRNRNKVAI